MKNIFILDKYTNEKEELGQYDLKWHRDKIEYQGVTYDYHSSGLVRRVYIDPSREFVLKIPHSEIYDDATFDTSKDKGPLPFAVVHNLLEFDAYQKCPEEKKVWFAKTELLDFGWLKQEFVGVESHFHSRNLREIGRRADGSVCLFDFDFIIEFQMREYFNTIETVFDHEFYYDGVIEILKEIK